MNREIMVEAYIIRPSIYPDKAGGYPDRLELQFTMNGIRYFMITGSQLIEMIKQVPKLPFVATIVKQEDGTFQFT